MTFFIIFIFIYLWILGVLREFYYCRVHKYQSIFITTLSFEIPFAIRPSAVQNIVIQGNDVRFRTSLPFVKLHNLEYIRLGTSILFYTSLQAQYDSLSSVIALHALASLLIDYLTFLTPLAIDNGLMAANMPFSWQCSRKITISTSTIRHIFMARHPVKTHYLDRHFLSG